VTVTIEDVRAVFKGSIDDGDLQVALDTAELIVAEQLASSGMSTDRLDRITVYLAAHFAQFTSESGAGLPGTLRRSKLGDADESYAVPTGSDMESFYRSTRWGQLAIALDTSNKLTSMGALPARFRVI
jgi:hypothetical protein